MIILLYKFVFFMQALYFLETLYVAVKFYRLKHPWSAYVSLAFFGDAANAMVGLLTFGFALGPSRLVLWVVVAALMGRFVMTAGVAVLALFFLGLIKGVGKYEQKNERTD